MNIHQIEGLSFDDVLLIPRFSAVLPDSTSVECTKELKLKLKIPIISAAMDTITGRKMAEKMAEIGGLGVIHKNMSIDEQCDIVLSIKEKNPEYVIACAVGVNDEERIKKLAEIGVDFLFINTAHGHTQNVINTVQHIKYYHKNVGIVAGNIATFEAAQKFAEIGVDGMTVGIGPGSICTTRIVTGCGVPQLTAISEVCRVKKSNNYFGFIIADGGIKTSGDIVKALAAGADYVMLGSMLSGTTECPGDIIEQSNKKYKSYRGMGSLEAMKDGSSDRYMRGEESSKHTPEGVAAVVEYKGDVEDIIKNIIGGVKQGLGYMGCPNLDTLRDDAKFMKISRAAVVESNVHSVLQIK